MRRIAATLAAAALLATAGTATAEPADEWHERHLDPASKPAAPAHEYAPRHLQPFITHVHAWLGRNYGLASTVGRPHVISVELWPFRRIAGTLAIYARAAVDLETCRMSYSHTGAHNVRLFLRHAAGARVRLPVRAATTAIHELLHCANPSAPEALVDTVAADLTAPFIRDFLGRGIAARRNPERLIEYPGAFGVFHRTGRAVGRHHAHPEARALRLELLRRHGQQ